MVKRLIAISILVFLSGTLHASPICARLFVAYQNRETRLTQEKTNSQYVQMERLQLREHIMRESRKVSQNSRMEESRGLAKYNDALGGNQIFLSTLKSVILNEQHWTDVGGGNGLAIQETITGFIPYHKLPKLKSTLISYDSISKSNDQMNVLTGRFIEEIPQSELMPSGLITDVYGAMSYSMEPHIILQKYWNAMIPNGKTLIYQGANFADFGKNNKVITRDGRVMGLRDWAVAVFKGRAKINTFTVESENNGLVEMNTLIIEKKEHIEIQIPDLEIVDFKPGLPPTFLFREKGESKVDMIVIRNDMREKALQAIQRRSIEKIAPEFLDSYRSGSWSNPVIAAIKSLKSKESWLNISPLAKAIGEDLSRRSDYGFHNHSEFLWIDQKIMEHRAIGIKFENFEYQPMISIAKTDVKKKAKLITDYYGDMVNQYDPVRTLKKYASELESGGRIFIAMGTESQGIGMLSTIRLKDGSKISLREWLVKKVPGIKAKFHRTAIGPEFGVERSFVELEVKDLSVLMKLNELGLVGFYKAGPDGIPVPLYQEK